ncbi:MAG: transglycosylase domain-containing protein [Bacteroidales bacterium]|nr:transglycosylase domain-containing protein [Bacteroidales bacterium]
MEKSQEKTEQKSKGFKRYIWILWSAFLIPLVSVAVLFYLIANGHLGYMPTWEELENPKSNLATQVISSDAKVLGTFFKENRTLVEYEELSPFLVDALVATEDERFYSHSGIDTRALARAVVNMGSKGGGSTISQQLAKLLFHDPAETKWERIVQKLNEWVMAIMLERRYTKEEIITLYFNRFDFLNLAVGIQTAAHVYFNKQPSELNIQESAMLVGMCKNPALYNPLRRLEQVKDRRNTVLAQMLKNSFINQHDYDSLKFIPIELDFQRVDHSLGLAPYFREHIRLLMQAKQPQKEEYWNAHQFSVDSLEWVKNPLYGWVVKNPKPDGTFYDLYRDGLQIHTTINSRLQKYAEQAVEEHIGKELQKDFWKEQEGRSKAPFAYDMTEKQINEILYRAMKQTDRYKAYKRAEMTEDSIDYYFHQPVEMSVFSWSGEKDTLMSPLDSIRYYKYFLRSGLMSMDPTTGYVKAYVGGINYTHFKYDMVFDGRRQVGSTFKPILYSLALQEDFTPCSKLPNIPHSIALPEGGVWTPKNADISKTDGKMITLKDALANSNNFISAYLIDRYSPGAMVTMAQKLGITTKMDAVPSICLGTPDVSLFEMLPMYCTFGNKGVYTKPVLVTHIKDKNGNLLATFQAERTEVYDEKTAYLMVNLLEGVINRGTSIRLRFKYGFTNDIYGKTGTTQNHSDGWFFGVTPQLATGIWVGGEDRSVHFKGIRLGQGANMALPIWALYMKKVYADEKLNYSQDEYFERPPNIRVELDCNKTEENQSNLDYGF